MDKLQKDLSAYRTARTALMQAQTQPGSPVDNLPQLKPVHCAASARPLHQEAAVAARSGEEAPAEDRADGRRRVW